MLWDLKGASRGAISVFWNQVDYITEILPPSVKLQPVQIKWFLFLEEHTRWRSHHVITVFHWLAGGRFTASLSDWILGLFAWFKHSAFTKQHLPWNHFRLPSLRFQFTGFILSFLYSRYNAVDLAYWKNMSLSKPSILKNISPSKPGILKNMSFYQSLAYWKNVTLSKTSIFFGTKFCSPGTQIGLPGA